MSVDRVCLIHTGPPDRPHGSMVRYGQLVRDALALLGEYDVEEIYLCPPQSSLRHVPTALQTPVRYAHIAAQARRVLPKKKDVILHLLDGSHAYMFGTTGKLLVPVVVTVHDMIPALRAEGVFPINPPSRAGRWIVERATQGLLRADRLMAVSANTRNDVARITGRDLSTVDVVYSAVTESGRVAASLRPCAEPYLLHVAGNNTFYKNRIGVVDLFDGVHAQHPIRLCMVGAPPDAVLMDRVRRSPVSDQISFHTDVTDTELQAWYRHAEVFLFPSLYEGFGWPPLEAMQQGCPVVCSRAGSLEEVVADAALTADALDVQAMVAHTCRLLNESALRSNMIVKGRQHVQAYGVSNMAAGLMNTYGMVAKIKMR